MAIIKCLCDALAADPNCPRHWDLAEPARSHLNAILERNKAVRDDVDRIMGWTRCPHGFRTQDCCQGEE